MAQEQKLLHVWRAPNATLCCCVDIAVPVTATRQQSKEKNSGCLRLSVLQARPSRARAHRGQIKHQRWVYMFCDRVSDARFYLARDVLRLTACTTEGTHSKSLSARRPGALSVDSSGRVPGQIGQGWTDRAPAARGRGVSVEILGGCCGRREPLRMHFSAHSDICMYLSKYLSISLPTHTHTYSTCTCVPKYV